MNRTSGQPRVKLSLLHSISLKIRPLKIHFRTDRVAERHAVDVWVTDTTLMGGDSWHLSYCTQWYLQQSSQPYVPPSSSVLHLERHNSVNPNRGLFYRYFHICTNFGICTIKVYICTLYGRTKIGNIVTLSQQVTHNFLLNIQYQLITHICSFVIQYQQITHICSWARTNRLRRAARDKTGKRYKGQT